LQVASSMPPSQFIGGTIEKLMTAAIKPELDRMDRRSRGTFDRRRLLCGRLRYQRLKWTTETELKECILAGTSAGVDFFLSDIHDPVRSAEKAIRLLKRPGDATLEERERLVTAELAKIRQLSPGPAGHPSGRTA
jgi:hypothetical protein